MTRYAQCDIELEDGSGGGTPGQCSHAKADDLECFADCAEKASCAGLAGTDLNASGAFANCLGSCPPSSGSGGAGGSPTTTTTSTTTTSTTTSTTSTTTTSTTSTTTTSSTTTTTTVPPGTCADEPTYELCADCCAIEEHPAAYELLLGYALYECACVSSAFSPCFTLCGDLCSGIEPNASCVACINTEFADDSSLCVSSGVQNCYSDFDCAPFVDCALGCPP